MKFNMKYKTTRLRNATSGEIRKCLSNEGLTVKQAKEPIALAIHCFFEGRRHFEVSHIPHVTLLPASIDKKVMEAHRNRIAEKEQRRLESEAMADENEKTHPSAEKMYPRKPDEEDEEKGSRTRRTARRRKQREEA